MQQGINETGVIAF